MRGNVAAKALLNRPEQTLYGRLVRTFPGHIILSQVALSRLLVVDPIEAKPESATCSAIAGTANRFGQLIADFVVCRADFTALAVVELDTPDTAGNSQRERNRRKRQYLQAAGVKLVRFPANDLPSESALRALIAALPVTPRAAQLTQVS